MPSEKHFLLATIPALGHIRGQAGIAIALIFTQELAQWPVTEKNLSRIKVIGIGSSGKPERGKTFQWLLKTLLGEGSGLIEAYQAIIGRDSLTCTTTGAVFDYQNIAAPSAVFCDIFAPALAPYVKTTTPDVKIINIWITTAGAIKMPGGKRERGGTGDSTALEKWEDGKKTLDEGAKSIYKEPSLIQKAVGVRRHAYEMKPQGGGEGHLPVSMLLASREQVNRFADASITAITRVFEPGSSKVLQDCAAPYKAPSVAARAPFQPVYNFLDSYPPKSVMLVSFGSVSFPSQPWQLEMIFKTLLETRTPFITSRAPAMYKPFDPELERRPSMRVALV
ncbi:hypothetical protein FRB96_002244 [Tulasnella sp. 330]|nr:hypothetical protein FRB96_002244 [Tulasnella sp. 330]